MNKRKSDLTRKNNLDSWNTPDVHSGKNKFIKGGGRKSDRSLSGLESKKTQKWDKAVDDWIRKNS